MSRTWQKFSWIALVTCTIFKCVLCNSVPLYHPCLFITSRNLLSQLINSEDSTLYQIINSFANKVNKKFRFWTDEESSSVSITCSSNWGTTDIKVVYFNGICILCHAPVFTYEPFRNDQSSISASYYIQLMVNSATGSNNLACNVMTGRLCEHNLCKNLHSHHLWLMTHHATYKIMKRSAATTVDIIRLSVCKSQCYFKPT